MVSESERRVGSRVQVGRSAVSVSPARLTLNVLRMNVVIVSPPTLPLPPSGFSSELPLLERDGCSSLPRSSSESTAARARFRDDISAAARHVGRKAAGSRQPLMEHTLECTHGGVARRSPTRRSCERSDSRQRATKEWRWNESAASQDAACVGECCCAVPLVLAVSVWLVECRTPKRAAQ